MSRLLLPALVVLSGASANASDDPLEEITVVGARRVIATSDVALSVTSAERDSVTTEKLVTDALRSLAGVTVQQTTPGQGAPIIRGLKGSAILHLVDGMRLNNAIFRAAPTPWFALVPASSVERLEVVRGAPAALYGSEAVGGVVQSVSRLPVFATESISSTGMGLVAFDTAESLRSVRASLDAGTRELAASISAEYLETGDRRIGGGWRVSPTGYTARAVRAVVSATPSGAGSWFADLHYLEQPETPRIDELVPGFGQPEPSSAEFFFAPNRRAFAHFQRRSRWRDIDLELDAAWQRIDDDRRTRNFGSTQRRFETNRSDLYGLTVSASGRGDSWSWITGADLYYDVVSSTRSAVDLVSGAGADLDPRFPDGSTVSQAGVYVSGSRRIGAHHRLSVGVRYTDLRIDLSDGTAIRPGRASGDLGWISEWRDGVQLVATVGSGFRAPNIADLGTLGERPGNRFNIPNTDLGSEHAIHGDLGLRLYDERFSGEVRVFALRYSDRIVSVSTGTTTADGRDVVQSVNAASASLHGIEGVARFRLGDDLSLQTRITWTYGIQDVAGSAEPADRIPPLQARFDLEWLMSDAWTFGARLVASGRQDRLSARDVDDVRIDPNGTPGWATAGARVLWTGRDAWRVDLGIDNLFDERYRVHGSGIDAPGRNLSLTLQFSW